ncbi:MAG TPA: DUF4157 domain-containing protein [Burkholderiaceae bacterium]|nr:DUF4157 domain-containing protein [Burkholderiaceae bacterium]
MKQRLSPSQEMSAQRVQSSSLRVSQPDASRAEGQNTELIDNRPQSATQRKLVDMVANSPYVTAQRAMHDGIHHSPQMVAQRALATRVGEGVLHAQPNATLPAQRAENASSVPNRTGLPDQLKAGVESLSGMSLDHVKVHYNSPQPAQLNAHAYAQGSEIHVASGQEKHLPHEAWHVVQQAQGRVQPTMQAKGVAVNDDKGLESEADVMGMKAMAMQPSEDAMRSTSSISGSAIQRNVIQRTIGIGVGVAVEQKSLIFRAVQLTAYMGDYDYARASLTALDGNNYDTLDLLKAAMPAPLTANQVYVGGAAITIVGTGGRCNAHMTQGAVVAALRTNKGDISVANGNDQRIQIGEGRTRSWKWGYVLLKFANGQLEYWHAHDGFQVG